MYVAQQAAPGYQKTKKKKQKTTFNLRQVGLILCVCVRGGVSPVSSQLVKDKHQDVFLKLFQHLRD